MSSPTQHQEDLSIPPTTLPTASQTYPLQMSALRKNAHVLIKTHPCKISELSTSKPGKHGHAKVNIAGYDIFTHRKYEDSGPAHAQVEVPVVNKREYLVLNVDVGDGFLSLWCEGEGVVREDVRVPEGEVGEKLVRVWKGGKREGMVVVVLKAMEMEMVVEVKESHRG